MIVFTLRCISYFDIDDHSVLRLRDFLYIFRLDLLCGWIDCSWGWGRSFASSILLRTLRSSFLSLLISLGSCLSSPFHVFWSLLISFLLGRSLSSSFLVFLSHLISFLSFLISQILLVLLSSLFMLFSHFLFLLSSPCSADGIFWVIGG